MIIVDTGPLVTLADADDDDHERCVRWLNGTRSSLLVPAPIVAEVCYLLGTRCGAPVEAAFLGDIAADATFHAVAPTTSDYQRMAELVRKYADLPLGESNACVVATAERFKAQHIATLDQRDFRVVRPSHVATFTLLPE